VQLVKELQRTEKKLQSQERWYTSVIPELGRPRQEDHWFQASLGYIMHSDLSPKRKKKKN
jgi:hypothetical protein